MTGRSYFSDDDLALAMVRAVRSAWGSAEVWFEPERGCDGEVSYRPGEWVVQWGVPDDHLGEVLGEEIARRMLLAHAAYHREELVGAGVHVAPHQQSSGEGL